MTRLPLRSLAYAQRAYFVTYDHQMEEPGNLEISVNPIFASWYGDDARGIEKAQDLRADPVHEAAPGALFWSHGTAISEAACRGCRT